MMIKYFMAVYYITKMDKSSENIHIIRYSASTEVEEIIPDIEALVGARAQ